MSLWRHVTSMVRAAATAALLLGLLATALWFKQGHYQLLSVQSQSMQPAVSKGDALLVKQVPVNQLTPGGIVSYHSPVNSRLTVSHRLVSVDLNHHELTTKGDSLSENDPPVPFENIVGEAVALAPGGGRLIDFFHTLPGLVTFVYVPAAIVVIGELKRLLAAQSAKSYRRYGYR